MTYYNIDSLNVEELNDLQDLIDKLVFTNPISASEYIEIDKANENDEINLQDIISIINPTEEDQNQEEIIEEFPPIVTNKGALSATKTLDIYIEQTI